MIKYTIRSIVCEASCHLVTRSLGQSVRWSLGHSVFNVATDWLTNGRTTSGSTGLLRRQKYRFISPCIRVDAGAGPGRDAGPQQPQVRPRGGPHLHPHRARGGAANHLCQIETLPHTVPKVTCCRNTEIAISIQFSSAWRRPSSRWWCSLRPPGGTPTSCSTSSTRATASSTTGWTGSTATTTRSISSQYAEKKTSLPAR